VTRLGWPERVETHTIQSMCRAGQLADLVYIYPGYTYPPESRLTLEDETRTTLCTFPRPGLAEGECRWCHGVKTVNYLQECVSCYEPRRKVSSRNPWHPPREADDVVLKGRWQPTLQPFKKLPDHYFHPPRPDRPTWRSRPWQRYRWQVEDGWKSRIHRVRTAPGRLKPEDDCTEPVLIRCLVCLGVFDALRHDQVCESCEENWRDSGQPRGYDYEFWVAKRRVSRSKKSPDHLGAYDRAIYYARYIHSPDPCLWIVPVQRHLPNPELFRWDTMVLVQ
jgi:hypothetical protein